MLCSPLRRSLLQAGLLLAILIAPSASNPLLAHDAPAETLRVMTYNIHHGQGTDDRFDLERLARIINEAKPDLVALQEVDRRTGRSSGVDQAAELARLTGLHMAFGKSIDLEGGEYGNAVLSRTELSDVQVHRLPSPEEGEPRTALSVQFTLPGRPTSKFVSTHLCHLSAANRLVQVKELQKLFGGSDPPVILAGDLNARPRSPAMAPLREGWSNPLEDSQTIDYVLMRSRDGWRPRAAHKRAEPVASDHDPVVVELAWPEAR